MEEKRTEAERQTEMEDLYRQGMECFTQQNWQGAIGFWGQVNRIDAEYQDVLTRLEEARRQQMLEFIYDEASSYFRKGKWSRAREKFEAVLAEEPGYRDAEQKLREAKKREELAEWYSKAQEHLLRKNWREAIICLKEVIKLEPDYGGAKASLDKAERELTLEELYQEAIQHFDRQSWQNAGESFNKILEMQSEGYRDVREKLDEVDKQLRLADQFEKARGCESVEEWSEAIRIYIEILTEDPVYPGVGERLARAQNESKLLEKYKQARSYLTNGEWTAAIELLNSIVEQRENYKDAAQVLQKARDKQEANILYMGGLTHYHGEEWSQAVEKLERVIQLDPDNEDASRKLEDARQHQTIEELRREGIRHLRMGELQEAIRRFKQVLNIASDDQTAKDLLEEATRQQEEESQQTGDNANIGLVHPQPSPGLPREEGGEQSRSGAIITGRNRDVKSSENGEKGWRWWMRYVVVPLLASGGVIAILLNHYLGLGLLGSTPVALPIATLRNGDFEDKFKYWQHGGELDQDIRCEGGQCYAVLGDPRYKCEGGVPVGEAWIKQSFQVPETMSPTLSLRYRVSSYDLDNQDFFQVSINGKPAGKFGNTEWTESSCSREAWDSGWQFVEFDLIPYSGDQVQVSLSNVNGTDGGWNTWTYVDDVEVH
jgi:outer membrane protein assembly factor BamD (BamD/ComL family)